MLNWVLALNCSFNWYQEIRSKSEHYGLHHLQHHKQSNLDAILTYQPCVTHLLPILDFIFNPSYALTQTLFIFSFNSFVSVCLSSLCLFICVSSCLSICPSFCLSICLFVCLSVSLTDNLSKILNLIRVFLLFQYWLLWIGYFFTLCCPCQTNKSWIFGLSVRLVACHLPTLLPRVKEIFSDVSSPEQDNLLRLFLLLLFVVDVSCFCSTWVIRCTCRQLRHLCNCS